MLLHVSLLVTASLPGWGSAAAPAAEAALSDKELVLMRNMMARVDRLAQAAAQARNRTAPYCTHAEWECMHFSARTPAALQQRGLGPPASSPPPTSLPA